MASVLLVEDEALIRMMIAEMVIELGHSVVGEAGDLATGQALARSVTADAAILDVKLGSESSDAIAAILADRGVPFAFASGYGSAGLPEGFRERPVIRKPFSIEELAGCMKKLLD